MISILGTGTMGKGIAIEFAKFNNNVQLITVTRNNMTDLIRGELEKVIDKFQYQNKEQILGNISISQNIGMLNDSELVIEAITESIEIKRNLLLKIRNHVKPEAVIASNTSSISIEEIFNQIFDLDRVIGLHFFNPVQIMKLVEVVYTESTSQSTIDYAKQIANSLGKEFVVVKDSPGFIVNRLLIPMINEAAKIADEGVATVEDIDKAMRLGANHPIGPLKLSDLIGNDVSLSIMEIMQSKISNTISDSLRKLVSENRLGRKTKVGFYKYGR